MWIQKGRNGNPGDLEGLWPVESHGAKDGLLRVASPGYAAGVDSRIGCGGYDRFRFKHPFKQSLDSAVQIHLKPAQEELEVLVSSINARRRVF